MQHLPLWPTPQKHIERAIPEAPTLYFAPSVLRETAQQFQQSFDGLVTYAVKANERVEVLSTLWLAGVRAFDVASPAEMAAVRAIGADAVLHYNNPMRSDAEVTAGIAARVASWSVDDISGLDQLDQVPRPCEVAVRFALPVAGAAYDFGSKFGAAPETAIALLREVAARGFSPSLCFHPGTQCEDTQAWVAYVAEAARISIAAGVRLARLNIGGGFAVDRGQGSPDLATTFAVIKRAVNKHFVGTAPTLICEPGRSMVANCATLACKIKGIRHAGSTVFLNDGIYGGLVDLRDMGLTGLVEVRDRTGRLRSGALQPRTVFGPTCDSLDRLPDGLMLPHGTEVGDYVLFGGMGAYSISMSTAFNGYGLTSVETVAELPGLTGQAA